MLVDEFIAVYFDKLTNLRRSLDGYFYIAISFPEYLLVPFFFCFCYSLSSTGFFLFFFFFFVLRHPRLRRREKQIYIVLRYFLSLSRLQIQGKKNDISALVVLSLIHNVGNCTNASDDEKEE